MRARHKEKLRYYALKTVFDQRNFHYWHYMHAKEWFGGFSIGIIPEWISWKIERIRRCVNIKENAKL